jgi:type 1 fimbria pilin
LFSFSGTADPNYTNAAADGVLATNGGSTGVGVQLRRRDTSAVMPLNQDNTWSSNYTSGNLTLPMEARYMKNNEAVTAGQANATATFTMSYP